MDDVSHRFQQVETLHDLLKYLEDWNFHIGKRGHDGLRRTPVQYADWEGITGAPIEVGIITENGQPIITIAQRENFGGAPPPATTQNQTT